jgi:hypothetical protein
MHRRSLYIMHLALYPCLSSPTDFSEEPKMTRVGGDGTDKAERKRDWCSGCGDDAVMPNPSAPVEEVMHLP